MEAKPCPDSILRFGVFELDLRSSELRKDGVRIKVQDSPLRALRLFLSHPQQVLSRQDLRKALWADDVFVDFDRAINSTINRLRETLGDGSSNPVFIETVARFGYRWIAPVQVVPRTGDLVGSSDAPPEDSPPEVSEVAAVDATKVSLWLRWPLAMAVLVVAVALVIGWGRVRANRSALDAAHATVTAGDAGRTAKAHDPQAEELYLSGRYYWNKRTPEGLRQAADFFTQAIVRDPHYAQAYVGLADTYDLMREFASMPDDEAYPRAFSAASKAVELDDSSAEAHATLGFISFWWKRDTATANREFQHALVLNPAYVDAYHWYGNILGCQGRAAEGVKYLNRAQELDPGSRSIRADKAEALLIWGHRDEGVALLKQIEATDIDFASPHLYLAQLYFVELDGPHFLDEQRALSRLRRRPDDQLVQKAAERGFATGGAPGMLQSILVEQKRLYAAHRLSAYQVARTEALLGDRTGALAFLHVALQRNEAELAILRVDLALNRLHDLPEFRQVVVAAGLPPLG